MVGGERLLRPPGEGANGSGGAGGGMAARSSSEKKKKGKRLTGEVAALEPRARPRRQDLRSGVPDGERRRGRGGPGGVWLSARPSEGGGGERSAWRAHERGSRPAVARTQRRRVTVRRRACAGAGEREAPTSGPAQRVGPSRRESEEGREGACGPGFQI
jgi:hypothetical protein